jgi:hypothetical protein
MARLPVFVSLLFAGFLAFSFVPSASAAATPSFQETVVVEDTDGDFAGREALDIVAVYVTETFGYDPEKKILLGNNVVFRIEVVSPDAVTCGTMAKYEVLYKVDGAEHNASASVFNNPSNVQSPCSPAVSPGANRVGNSLIVVMPAASLGVVPGSQLTDFWARSSVGPYNGAGSFTDQDIAPNDNANSPSPPGTVPTEGLLSYTSIGVFPFINVVPSVPTEQYSVNGGEVEYAFQFFSHEGLSSDNIRVRFEIPEGWTVSPSRGSTGKDPEGQLSGGSGGTPVEFTFTASSTGIVNEGDVANVIMHVITDSGGYQKVVTTTTVSGAKISDANLTFDLQSKGPFTAEETSTIRFKAEHPTIDLAGETLSIDVYSGTRRITTLTAKPMGAGVYEVMYSFPGQGEFRLDFFISSMKPSPHQEFTVNVEKGGLAPGPGFAMILLIAFVGVAGYLRRNP